MKNYTTTIDAEKSLGQIQRLLAMQGASHVMTEYDEGGVPTHVSFKLRTIHGEMPFRLPARAEGVLRALEGSPKVPNRLATLEQAHRVAWRIILHWLENQLAMVEAEICTFYQVVLPWLQIGNGETVMDRFEEKGPLLLE
jgi:hypothetical protein